MERFTRKELRNLSEFVRDLYQLRTHDQFTSHLISSLPTVTEGEFTSYNEYVIGDQRVIYKSDQLPYCSDPLHYAQALQHNLHEHRVLTHFLDTKDESAHIFSDFSSSHQFRRTGIYNEFYKPLKMSYLLFMGFRVNMRMLSVSRHRNDKEFTYSAKAVFNVIHPHIKQALRNSLAVARMQSEMDTLRNVLTDDNDTHATMSVTVQGRIRFSSQNAQQLLRSYGLQGQKHNRLPLRLQDWVGYHHKSTKGSEDVPEAIQPLVIEGEPGKLRIRLIPQGSHYVLILTECRMVPSLSILKDLGLSVRESEILTWVARGKTNPEIGLILNISRRTVHKHLEHVYLKLRVENRMAAVAMVANATCISPAKLNLSELFQKSG